MRQEAIQKDDIPLYQHYVTFFEREIENRLFQNSERMMKTAHFTPATIELSQDYHFQNLESDFVWILNVDDYLHVDIPEGVTIEIAE